MRADELKHYDEDTLVHYGVTGMKWGVRKSRPDGVSRSTNRQARKDAKEFTQAKQFYGDGAGTNGKTAYSKAKVEFRAQQIKRQFKQNGFKI